MISSLKTLSLLQWWNGKVNELLSDASGADGWCVRSCCLFGLVGDKMKADMLFGVGVGDKDTTLVPSSLVSVTFLSSSPQHPCLSSLHILLLHLSPLLIFWLLSLDLPSPPFFCSSIHPSLSVLYLSSSSLNSSSPLVCTLIFWLLYIWSTLTSSLFDFSHLLPHLVSNLPYFFTSIISVVISSSIFRLYHLTSYPHNLTPLSLFIFSPHLSTLHLLSLHIVTSSPRISTPLFFLDLSTHLLPQQNPLNSSSFDSSHLISSTHLVFLSLSPTCLSFTLSFCIQM